MSKIIEGCFSRGTLRDDNNRQFTSICGSPTIGADVIRSWARVGIHLLGFEGDGFSLYRGKGEAG